MKRTAIRSTVSGLVLALAFALPCGARAADAANYAQHLVDDALARNPDVIIMAMHVTPPKNADNVIVASNIGRIGKKADEDDLDVIKTGKSKLEVNKAGDRFEVEEALRDVSGDIIGAVGIVFPYKAGDDQKAREAQADAIAKYLSRHISNVENLMQPWPFDPNVPSNTVAQQLVDTTLDKHPELLILALHVTPPGASDNIILGSNIGRIGKKADDDDMAVVKSGKTHTEVNATGKRFEVESQLKDAKGAVIGAISTVYAYKKGDDEKALQKRGEALRDEVGKQIASTAALMERTAAPPAPKKAAEAAPLKLAGRTELPGYEGDCDHFAVDVAGNRLFLAAEDHGTLEVFDLKTGAHLKTVSGVEVPHSPLYLPEANRLIVTDSGKGLSKIYDAKTYKVVGTLKLAPGADSMGYDPAAKRMYVLTGGKDGGMTQSFLEAVEPLSGKQLGKLTFDTPKIESVVIEEHGPHLYMNVTGKGMLAAIDKQSLKIDAQWPVTEAEVNAPLAFDEANRRLFVVTRKPGKLIVKNADTGATVAAFTAPERTDQVIFDAGNHRVYVAGGEGNVAVLDATDPNHYAEPLRVPSAVGAKTGILVPELNRLYLAVSPGDGKTGAAIIWFDVAKASS